MRGAEARERVLQHERHALAARAPSTPRASRQFDRTLADADAPGCHDARREQAAQRPGGERLAGAGLPDDAQRRTEGHSKLTPETIGPAAEVIDRSSTAAATPAWWERPGSSDLVLPLGGVQAVAKQVDRTCDQNDENGGSHGRGRVLEQDLLAVDELGGPSSPCPPAPRTPRKESADMAMMAFA